MTVSVDLRIENEAWTSVSNLEALCTAAVMGALGHAGVSPPATVDILLSDDDTLAELNAKWRGKSGPTDVLSFPADVMERPFLGDIAITFGVAERDASAYGKTMEAHLTHLLVHGVLHLLGHDHETENEAQQMELLEKQVLAELGFSDPYSRIEPS
ncbi:MAG: rRNA maturation RNase YbeY [Pseudomonadota bacterium]